MKKLLLLSAFVAFYSIPVTAQVCMPVFGFGCAFDQVNSFSVTGINSTVINTLNTNCGTDAHEDFTSYSVTFAAGGQYEVSITSGSTSADNNVQVFIDFNDDDIFTSSESVGGMNNIADNVSLPSIFLITMPANPPVGSHTMRVIVSIDAAYPNIISCPGITDQYSGGEVHDYTANFGTMPACDAPTSLTALGLTFDGASINWSSVFNGLGYKYVLDQNPADPSIAGTTIIGLSYNAIGLLSNTTYYFHIRTDCGGQHSPWIDIPFTTLACPTPTGITESAITASSATVSWTTVTGALGYNYAVNVSPTPPTTGTYSTGASHPVTGLTPMTVYRTWVRTVCGQNDTSAWNPVHTFTTLPVSVVNVSDVNFKLEAYPNPTRDVVTVTAVGKGTGEATFQLTDILGKLIGSYMLTTDEVNIDVSSLSTGIYFIRYVDETHRQTIRINKE